MSKTYYEGKAEELLAKRGEHEKPNPLVYDLAAWLEQEHDLGYISGIDNAERLTRDMRRDLAALENHLKDAKRQGRRCSFVFTDGQRCAGSIQHEGHGHYTEGAVP